MNANLLFVVSKYLLEQAFPIYETNSALARSLDIAVCQPKHQNERFRYTLN